jgi:cytochrome c oxidase subunit 2
MQNLALTLSLLVMAAIATVFLWVVAGASRASGDAGAIATSAFRWRDRLFWIVILTGVVVTFATLWPWPVAGHAASAAKADVVIRATASQWRWELDRDTVAPGQLVEFELTSRDVNHGFAIYKDKNHVVAQAQAMPGYVNKLQLRFAEPGDYEVLCLEYCGVAHHAMRTVIKVRAGS